MHYIALQELIERGLSHRAVSSLLADGGGDGAAVHTKSNAKQNNTSLLTSAILRMNCTSSVRKIKFILCEKDGKMMFCNSNTHIAAPVFSVRKENVKKYTPGRVTWKDP